MIAMSGSTSMDDGPDEIEALLPWYAAGTLSPGDARRVADALGRDAALQRQYAAIRDEQAETIALNQALGAPSARALQNLMAAIAAEPSRAAAAPAATPRLGRFTRLFASLSPRTLAWSASFGAMALMLQAGLIGVILTRSGLEAFQSPAYRQQVEPAAAARPAPVAPAALPASPERERVARSAPSQADQASASIATERSAQQQVARRSMTPSNATLPELGVAKEVVAAVTFHPDARMSDVSALLGSYRASVIGSRDGVLQLRFEGMTTPAGLDVVLAALRKERIVAEAVAAP